MTVRKTNGVYFIDLDANKSVSVARFVRDKNGTREWGVSGLFGGATFAEGQDALPAALTQLNALAEGE